MSEVTNGHPGNISESLGSFIEILPHTHLGLIDKEHRLDCLINWGALFAYIYMEDFVCWVDVL